MTRAEDLSELGLAHAAEERAIRKAYLSLSKSRHPDKGGSKESFQRLSSAYMRLSSSGSSCNFEASPAAAHHDGSNNDSEEQDDGDYSDDDEYWYQEYYDFFPRAWRHGFSGDDDDDFDEYFRNWRETSKCRRARQRQEDLKRGYDYRDDKPQKGQAKCMFCGVNRAITREGALESGLDWDEYSAHPDGYQTCWICKDKHVSVMTKAMACKKFAKVLDFKIPSSRTGVEYHPVFWFLKLDGKSFHHQPITTNCEGPTRNSEYYWYPDLEDEAFARGWKPRGTQKEEVPWMRKDLSTSTMLVKANSKKRRATPKTQSPPKAKKPRATKKKKAAPAVTPEGKK
jgi:hypothetical protein